MGFIIRYFGSLSLTCHCITKSYELLLQVIIFLCYHNLGLHFHYSSASAHVLSPTMSWYAEQSSKSDLLKHIPSHSTHLFNIKWIYLVINIVLHVNLLPLFLVSAFFKFLSIAILNLCFLQVLCVAILNLKLSISTLNY